MSEREKPVCEQHGATLHSLQQMVQEQRRTGSPHMQAKNWKLWNRSLSFVPPDGGNVTIKQQFTNRTGQDRTGQDRTGQDWTGQDRTGQVCVCACACVCVCVWCVVDAEYM